MTIRIISVTVLPVSIKKNTIKVYNGGRLSDLLRLKKQ